MTQAGGTGPAGPARPGAPPPAKAPGDKHKLSYQAGLGTIFADLFEAIASLYRITTTGDLETLNQQLDRQTQQLVKLAAEEAATKCPNKLAVLQNEQKQIQTTIASLNVSMNAMTSSAASQATMLGKIIDTVKGLLSVTSNW